MTSESSLSDNYQFEGGGRLGDNRDDQAIIQEAKEILTTLNELRNPENHARFDFTDPQTGELRNYFDNGLTHQEKLDQVQFIIGRLKEVKKNRKDISITPQMDDNEESDQAEQEQKIEQIDNSLPAGDEFLIWEPRNCCEVVKNVVQNMIETYMFLIVAVGAYSHPSLNAVVFLILTVTLFHAMSKDIQARYKWNFVILSIIFSYLVIIVITKLVKQSKAFKDGRTFSKEEYKETINSLLLLGFSFNFNRDVHDPVKSQSLQCPCELTDFSFAASYDIEIAVLISALILLWFSYHQYAKLQNLMKISRQDFIDYIRLSNKSPDDDDEDEELSGDEMFANMELQLSKSQKRKLSVADKKAKKEKQDQEDLARLQKLIRINLVGSEKFYNHNQFYFVLGMLSMLFEAVSFNTLSSVPSLFMFIGLMSMYEIRKRFSRFYRAFSFFFVYWIQTVMIIKLCVEILLQIESINARVHGYIGTELEWENIIIQILFGKIHSQEALLDTTHIDITSQYWILMVFINIYFCQGWKTCKWLEIRDKTADIGFTYSSSIRFWKYIQARELEDQDEQKLVDIKKSEDSKKLKKMLVKNVAINLTKRQNKRYDPTSKVFKKARKQNTFLSQFVLMGAQINMFILAYMYHSSSGFVNLSWLIASFALSVNNTLFLSIVFMIPILTWEFIMIYMSRVHMIRSTDFFVQYGKYFRIEMMNTTLEQFFMLITLLLFYMMIASYLKRVDNRNVENALIRFFRVRINARKLRWIWVFYACRWAHIIILIVLFLTGVQHLDCITNLGYLGFFVIYTAYESAYRNSCRILILFSSLFILGQYIYSLHYQIYMRPDNEAQIFNLYWWNVFPFENKSTDNPAKDPFLIPPEGHSLYFRVAPPISEWINVILMKALIEINIMYTTEKNEEYKLRQMANDVIQESAGKFGYYFSRVKRIFFSIFNYLLVISMVSVQAIVEPSIISWIFFALNLINFSYQIKGSTKPSEIRKQYYLSNIIKVYSLLVIIVTIFVLGNSRKIDHNPDWQNFKQWLQIFGLKANIVDLSNKEFENLTPEAKKVKINQIENKELRNRMLATVIFFLNSMYLTGHFYTKMTKAREDLNFKEQHYKKLFEYKLKKPSESDQLSQNTSSSDDEEDRIGKDGMQESIYKIRKFYTQKDLIDFYEGIRFTLPFMTYRMIDHWWIMDIFAKYANVFITSIYVYACFGISVTLLNCLNLFLLVSYFFTVTIKVGRKAENLQKFTSVQSQCDIQMARLVTKKYKKETFYEFLDARKKTWKYMFNVLILASLLSYPTPLLDKIKQMHLNEEQKEQMNEAILVLFYTGLTLEKRQMLMLGLLLAGLAIERVAINWLENRFGCTHFKLQKFIELDERREAIRSDWDIVNPVYDVERYRKHYFRTDFNDLKKLMQNQTFEEMLLVTKMQDQMLKGLGDTLADQALEHQKDQYARQMYGDFVPLKVAQRIHSTVKFTIQLDCKAKTLNLDDQTKELVENDDVDYETVPVLKRHKIQALLEILKEAVDRKYKISWYKGIQLWIESAIIFFLVMSLIMKANFWSIVYLVFIIKFTFTRNKTNLMVRQCSYISISIFMQYVLFWLNMTAQSSIQSYPVVGKGEKSMANYPVGFMSDTNPNAPKYILPLFFQIGIFREHLSISYMLGIGIDSQQVISLTFDFINMFVMTMYIFEFRNPILNKNLKKVFWQFPTKDDTEQWARLDKNVQKQVDWIFSPKPLYRQNELHPNFKQLDGELTKQQINLANAQYKFAQEYNQNNQIDLNYYLTNYVDIKYQTIWGEEFMKEKKWEIKKNCIYFRLVKQGSQLVYITFHILTILLVLLMAAMRQSLFAVVYVLILIPRMKDGSEVLKQRDIQQGKEIEDLDNEIEELQDRLKQSSVKEQIVNVLKQKMGESADVNFAKEHKHLNYQIDRYLKMSTDDIEENERYIMISKNMDQVVFSEYTSRVLSNDLESKDDREILILLLVKKYRKMSGDLITELVQEEQELIRKRYKLQKKFQKKYADLRKTDRDQLAKKQWSMIKIMQNVLLTYALVDTIIQIMFQMPAVMPGSKYLDSLRKFGFRKIWYFEPGTQYYDPKDKPNDLSDLEYHMFIDCKRFKEDGTPTDHCPRFELDWRAFYFQFMNCFIIATIILQCEIFSSPGYQKYVTQHNGSMDLLMELSELKAKSITYVINNYKIRKILNIQRKREQTLATVEKLKEKITRWRQFTRTTLNNERGPSTFIESGAISANGDESPDMRRKSIRRHSTRRQSLAIDKQQQSEKSVKFEEQVEDISDDEEEEEEDAFLRAQKTKEQLRISPEDREYLLKQLAYDFVQSKMTKQRTCVRFYLWLQNTFVEKIIFKNKKSDLEQIKQKLAEGSILVPTELEALMTTEAEELIRQYYDNLEGSKELAMLLRANRDKSQSLLNLTRFDKKIKLNQLKMSWDYTRSLPMTLHMIETFFYILISQSQSIIYFSMILSMYMNAGFISLPYPIAVFGWALLEERRPGKKFWIFIRYYTEMVLLFKFLLNLDFISPILQSQSFLYYSSYLKLGIYDFDELGMLILYMLPEIMILCFLMLHEIKLQLIGLYDRKEEDVEPVLDAIERNLLKGDEEAVKAKKIETQNMCMTRYFESCGEQKKRKEEFMGIEKGRIMDEISKMTPVDIKHNDDYRPIIQGHYSFGQLKTQEVLEQLVEVDYNKKYPQDVPLTDQQQSLFKEIARSIYKTSTRFDLDTKGTKSITDDLVQGRVIQKSLESDNLIFVEGMRPAEQPKFMTKQQFRIEKTNKENWELLSDGEYKELMDEKFDNINDRTMFVPGIFERNDYFDRIFPSLKVQKPGYDLYGSTTTILALIGVYIFMFFDSYTFSQAKFDYHKGQSVLFLAEMAMMVLFIITIIIIERYANRSDTKKVEEKTITQDDQKQKKSFFSNEEMFKRTTTNRSMTVKIKTVKTSDLDMNSSAAQDFLNNLNGDDDDNNIEDSRTKITNQQKTKFIIHWLILIFSHLYCFWLVPIKANVELYGMAACDLSQKEHYGCYQFKENPYIRVLYILFVLYLVASAYQLSYGFPILKKASSVFQYYNDVGMVIAQVYNAIPFVIEIRCLLDFTFSKTSLDVFQFWQLFYYHFEMFIGWTGNRYYTIKTLGSQTECMDKFIFGVLISSGLLFLLIGPFYLFSTASPLVANNPVTQGKFEISLQINKTIAFNPRDGNIKQNPWGTKWPYVNITSSLPYRLYYNENPYLEEFTDQMWKDCEYSSKTETRDFKPSQVQYCVLRRHSDKAMGLSVMSKSNLFDGLILKEMYPWELNVSAQQYYRFERAQPVGAEESYYKVNRSLDYDYLNDCITGKELAGWADFDCGNIKDKSMSHDIIFTQMFNPALVLGQSNFAVEVKEKQKFYNDLLHDIKMTYFCDDSWDIRASLVPTRYARPKDPDVDQFSNRWVDQKTCFLNNTKAKMADEFEKEREENQMSYDEYHKYKRESGEWTPITFQLFNMEVATGFLAAFTPITFYAIMVYGLSATVRLTFIFSTWMGYTYELTKPEPMMKLIECCYMMRHEENLIAEEECYRMLQEIIRQPDLYKQLSGTSLAGSMHPDLDHLNKEQRRKLAQLDKLERKGWDVAALKNKIITGDRKIDDDF